MNIFKIRITNGRSFANQANKFPDLKAEIERIAQKALDGVTNLALAGAKSVVPVDTFELRGRGLNDGMIRSEKTDIYASRVYVTQDIHYGRRKQPKPALELVKKYLEKNKNEKGAKISRSMNSAAISYDGSSFSPVSKGQPTEFIAIAERQMNQQIRGYLKAERWLI